ncbi:bifunctional folylpolyglutamate synthase/dihydrofolate synthase [Microlunatus capsulatus]|uniref:tetrahydrofolate synthase n=1 Tax=Microlunatus capsulatus TaxID=99117 RepID=A0ABS4Z7D4_9ACTN|nr:folylpolyglutamate synthase/dihydrofolate synthase family protein [Microlunatus capsulatus]MBP2416158.1 dihydrofolate synthase/folylpolyglutamate synthase [Microlunatus capsulatus]
MPEPQSHAQIVAALTRRWPEHRVAPSLARVQALTGLLGDPQHAFRVIHVTGTNGKGSTSAMIESLLRATGLRTGRFTSPHVTAVNERITIDGEPISDERFDEVWREVEPLVALVDEQQLDGVSMTFFEIITCMAFAAFADAPVDVAVLEVGLGGTWDATNVADGDVAVVTPIDLDHTHLLGGTVAEIAAEKAGIIKPGAQAILAGQPVEAAAVLLARCAEVGAIAQREGLDFGVLGRQLAVGGQMVRLNGAEGPVDDVFLPLYGAHQANNAAQALAAVEAFLGLKAVNPDVVREGFAQVIFPGRLEVVRRGPAVVLDAAHNPHGARATAAALTEAFAFNPLVGVVAVMADKDARGLLEVFEEVMNEVVVTQVSSTSRGMPADELGELAAEVFGPERVTVAPRLDDALEVAVGRAEAEGAGTPGVVVTGSVVLVGEARALLVTDTPEPAPTPTDDLDDDWADDEEDPDGDEGVDPYDGFLPGAGSR